MEQKNFINQITAQMQLSNNCKIKPNSSTVSFSNHLRIGQNDIFSTNEEEESNFEDKDFVIHSNIENIKNEFYDYDDNVNITDFKF